MNHSDLKKCDLQYQVRHKSTDKFKVGEIVFLKSNPEWPMKVAFIDNEEVTCEWKNSLGNLEGASFPPECLLQYVYAGLIVWKGTNLCLN